MTVPRRCSSSNQCFCSAETSAHLLPYPGDQFQHPVCFLTNSGGYTEARKAEQLSGGVPVCAPAGVYVCSAFLVHSVIYRRKHDLVAQHCRSIDLEAMLGQISTDLLCVTEWLEVPVHAQQVLPDIIFHTLKLHAGFTVTPSSATCQSEKAQLQGHIISQRPARQGLCT